MASTKCEDVDLQTVNDLQKILWGNRLKDDIFSRWSQGFVFSKDEPTALVQHEGGPCAVIAPVQAYVLKHVLFSQTPSSDISQVTREEASTVLGEALSEILVQCAGPEPPTTPVLLSVEAADTTPDHTTFHSKLKCVKVSDVSEIRELVKQHIGQYQKQYGVLLFLYSLILSKGLEQIKNEMEDPSESLIDCTHGHGSQSLINMLLTGHAVSNVWDNDKDVSGLCLAGIKSQSCVGFLTLLEHLRYCEVGWFLKNPKYPIWVLGSETHLTVLFSREQSLVSQESPESSAKQVFSRYDPEGNGFISSAMLDQVLEALDLVSEKEYVDLMRGKLDSESLGIITEHSFMQEFFPSQMSRDVPPTFNLLHCNGLLKSCPDSKVVYQEACVKLEEEIDVQIITDTSPIKLCLATKWPSIQLNWKCANPPSLN